MNIYDGHGQCERILVNCKDEDDNDEIAETLSTLANSMEDIEQKNEYVNEDDYFIHGYKFWYYEIRRTTTEKRHIKSEQEKLKIHSRFLLKLSRLK